MGVGPVGARPPSHAAYYVALAGILGLLLMLLAYFACFCVKRVKELVQADLRSPVPAAPRPAAYPVQPVIRDGANAMVKLCQQVHPARSPPPAALPANSPSPTPRHTAHTTPLPLQTNTLAIPVPSTLAPPHLALTPPSPPQEKVPAPQAANVLSDSSVR